jgi:UDP-N-acetylglucosamine 2-epimerase
MLIRLEEMLLTAKPDWVLVYGDTNSTLAGALAAAKLRIPLAHVEAGLRSFNREMPEEHNRVVTDHCSDLLFCPTRTAVENLKREGITRRVFEVGDTIYDAVLHFSRIARERSTILEALGLAPKGYLLATVHRPYNTDVPENLDSILAALKEIGEPIVFPVHPRTRPKIDARARLGDPPSTNGNIRFVEPVGYLDMLQLEQNARLILTDSGGIQKEAYLLAIPCVTLRPETEWVETVDTGWNAIAGSDRETIVACARERQPSLRDRPMLFGSGRAAHRIVELLASEGQTRRPPAEVRREGSQ